MWDDIKTIELYNPDIDIESGLKKILTDQNLNDPYNYPIYCWRCGKKNRLSAPTSVILLFAKLYSLMKSGIS